MAGYIVFVTTSTPLSFAHMRLPLSFQENRFGNTARHPISADCTHWEPSTRYQPILTGGAQLVVLCWILLGWWTHGHQTPVGCWRFCVCIKFIKMSESFYDRNSCCKLPSCLSKWMSPHGAEDPGGHHLVSIQPACDWCGIGSGKVIWMGLVGSVGSSGTKSCPSSTLSGTNLEIVLNCASWKTAWKC
jgi:hypothetical protein